MSAILDGLELPIVGAPMAGGPSTPELVAAVSGAGGIGFLGAGYRTVAAVGADVAATRALTERPFGVNVFTPGGGVRADAGELVAYARRLAAEAAAAGVALGEPRHDDDAFAGKVEALVADPVAVVSFTFGLPPREAVDALRRAGSEVWITVTAPDEARAAARLAPDALIVQGVEAGGHRGVFADDEDASDLTLLVALQLVGEATDLPLVAGGGLATGAAVGAALVAGARAAQVGTAYLRATEAGTSAAQKDATATDAPTRLTRAFSGRTARGIVNRLLADHTDAAPRGYPEVHHLTTPLRAHGRASGDADLVNLWAGQAHALARAEPAAEITRRLAAEAREALESAIRRLR
ncbi:MAG TPA: nitronate monooxygenase [Baekduia sp.]|uniref:NAD(P)H-dependent flavin oxidoreductase n=1 Tax=Baekduia sp. TaxID=2600305 RepID=UPI002D795801|nr:nitronate monooxygenase [Baekduia sp.]HET6505280.1 nitronate monooxygenase [Baekduia sp.]